MTATSQLMYNQKWWQVSKPEMEFHMMNITYAALHMRAQTEKNDIFMQKRLYIDEAHTVLDMFRFAVFFIFQSSFVITTRIDPKDNISLT